MRRFAPALLGGLLLYVPSGALAEDAPRLDLTPGKWELTKTTESAAKKRSSKKTVCLRDGDPVPVISGASCKAEDRVLQDGKLAWKTSCTPKKQHKNVALDGTGEISGNGPSFSGTTTVELSFGDKKISVTTMWSGKRVGECVKK